MKKLATLAVLAVVALNSGCLCYLCCGDPTGGGEFAAALPAVNPATQAKAVAEHVVANAAPGDVKY